ncbi:MAG: hypothetical protein ACJ75J_12530, partial [Cytophagaceae bacterium]
GLVTVGSVNASDNNNKDKCPNCHKKVGQRKSVDKTKKGAKHGYYDVTHNKATKETKINQGNQKYKDRDDIK